MGILRKPHEVSQHYIPSGTPAVANGLLTIAGYPPIHTKDVLRVHNLEAATAGLPQITTIAGLVSGGFADAGSYFGISLGGFQEGSMTVRTQTVQARQNAAGSLTDAQINQALVDGLNAKFGRFVIVTLVVTDIVVTAKVNGSPFSAGPIFTDNTMGTFGGTITLTQSPTYAVGQLANAVNASQPRQLRDLFPHLIESTPAIITTALDKVEVEVYDRNFNGGDGSGRKKVISFYGSNARVTAIQNALDITDTSATDQSEPAQQVQVN